MSSLNWKEAARLFEELQGVELDQRIKRLEELNKTAPELHDALSRLLAIDGSMLGDFLETGAMGNNQDILPEGTRIGSFEIIHPLGQGGMGVVYRATQDLPRRDVALKVMHRGLGDSLLARRFRQEIQILAQLDHPGIVKLFEAGTTDAGQAYFAMEMAQGRPLGLFLAENSLTTREKAQLCLRICEAVHHAHSNGVIHRDLKPSNIMVSRGENSDLQARVLDFGIARARDLEGIMGTMHTVAGQLLGTMAYMSPEQATGASHALQPASDVFQLGVLFYELLTGQLPLDVSTSGFVEAIRQISEDRPPPLRKINPELPGDLEKIIDRALAKDPEDRYTDAGEMGRDFESFLEGRKVKRVNPSLKHIWRRTSRPLGFLLGLMIIISLGSWFLLTRPHGPPEAPGYMQLKRLTYNPSEQIADSALSPDGKLAIYTDHATLQLRLHNLQTGSKEILWKDDPDVRGPQRVAWHPSGEWILVAEVDLEAEVFRWVRLDLASRERTVLVEFEDNAYPEFSPDGSRLVYLANDDQEIRVWELISGQSSLFLRGKEGETFFKPTWGPQGERIAYIRLQNPGRTLECADFQGNETILGQPGDDAQTGFYQAPCWLPDGRLLFVIQDPDEFYSVVLMSIAMPETGVHPTGAPTKIYSFPDMAIQKLSYSDLSKTLLLRARQNQYQTRVFRWGEDLEGQPRTIEGRGFPTSPVAWTADGDSLLILELQYSPGRHLLVTDLDSEGWRMVDSFPGEAQPLGLNGDGTRLLLGNWPARLSALDLSSGGVIDLGLDVNQNEGSFILQPKLLGGASQYLLSREKDRAIFRELDPDWSQIIRTRDYPMNWEWRDNHSNAAVVGCSSRQEIAYATFEESVRIINVDDGNEKVIPVPFGFVQRMAWTRDGKWIYCVGMAVNQEYNYWIGRIDPATGLQELLFTTQTMWFSKPTPSPDGESIAVMGLELGVDLYLLEGI